jgi:deoxyadenosine/deoxycytidine kinase
MLQAQSLVEFGHYIGLHGSISSGKSTLLKEIKDFLEAHRLRADVAEDVDRDTKGHYFLVIDEPLDEWEASGLLAAFYEAPSPLEMGFAFQINAFETRLRKLGQRLSDVDPRLERRRVHVISERTMRDDRVFFATVCGTDPQDKIGLLWQVYCNLFSLHCPEILQRETLGIYLPVSVEKCLARMAKRDRQAEAGKLPSQDYITRLEHGHEEMLKEFLGEKPGRKVIRLDAFSDELTKEEIHSTALELIEQLIDYVSLAPVQ